MIYNKTILCPRCEEQWDESGGCRDPECPCTGEPESDDDESDPADDVINESHRADAKEFNRG